jgi:L-ascorbate metabolism protein UlaG (beta-lactamase superfamily)
MKRNPFWYLIASMLLVCLAGCRPALRAQSNQKADASAQEAVKKLHWFGTAAFLYNGSKVIYFDPISLAGDIPKADLILVTHAHNDHWSVADLQKVIGPQTKLIIGPIVSVSYEAAKDDLGIPATVLAEGQTTQVEGVSIQAVPAYDTLGHVKGSGGVGFLVTLDGVTMYHTGGTAAFPEMADYTSDIAFVPVYSRDAAQALVEVIPARIFIFEHTSFYAAQAITTLFTKDLGAGKTFLALQDGAYNP